jgi:nuclear cap-binding protein subunit 1|tara:strand:+ start:1285 stop:2184 length:900 start_codon:yes stop_codon:yes gene_type:complete
MRDAIIHCDGSPEMTRNLAGLLSNDLPSLTEPATRFLLECVEELPVKTPVYVALLGLLNKTASKFVEEFVNSLLERLELRLQSPNQDDQIRAKLLTRYITMLPSVHVLKSSSAIDVLDALLCAASDAADIAATRVSAKFTWQPRSDFLVKCALASTPWCGQSLASSTEPGSADAFDNLFRSVEEYLQKRSRSGPDPSSMTFASAVASADDDRTVVADDWLEEIFGRVNETRRAGRENPEAWTTASVPPLLSVFEEFSPESMTQETSNVHTPPPMKVPGVSIDAGAATALATFPVRPRLR